MPEQEVLGNLLRYALVQQYVEHHWSEFVDILAYVPQDHYEYQDLVVGRKVTN